MTACSRFPSHGGGGGHRLELSFEVSELPPAGRALCLLCPFPTSVLLPLFFGWGGFYSSYISSVEARGTV
jgi:hypothetical protein